LNSYKKAQWDVAGRGHGKWSFGVKLNEEFTIVGDSSKGNGKLKASLVVTVGGAKQKLRTNCGAHIGIGDQFGPLLVTGWSNTRGETCHAPQAMGSESESSTQTSSSISPVTGAGIVIGCVAAITLFVGIVVFRKNSKKGEKWSSSSTRD
jgi:hypothetical protein